MFKLKENGTTVSREIVAGLTTFFAMAYIIVVNPGILANTGMEWGAVFLATIISSVIGTLIMGLVANVPYAQAPGMGLNAFFTYTVVLTLGFTWQQALSMVFICGVINILITVTKLRKYIIKSIPRSFDISVNSEGKPSEVKMAPKVVGKALQASVKLTATLAEVEVTPIGMPIRVVTIMLISMAPFTLSTLRTNIMARPMRNNQMALVFMVAMPGTPEPKPTKPTFKIPM